MLHLLNNGYFDEKSKKSGECFFFAKSQSRMFLVFVLLNCNMAISYFKNLLINYIEDYPTYLTNTLKRSLL